VYTLYIVMCCVNAAVSADVEALPMDALHECTGAMSWEYCDRSHPDEYVIDERARALDALAIEEKLAVLQSGKSCEAVYVLNRLTRPGATVISNHRFLLRAACPPRTGAILQTVAAGLSMTLSDEPKREEAVLCFLDHIRQLLPALPGDLRHEDLAHLAYDCVAYGYDAFVEERQGYDTAFDLIMEIGSRVDYKRAYPVCGLLWRMTAQCARLRPKLGSYMAELYAEIMRGATEADREERENAVLDLKIMMKRRYVSEGGIPRYLLYQETFEALLLHCSDSSFDAQHFPSPMHAAYYFCRNEYFYERFGDYIRYARNYYDPKSHDLWHGLYGLSDRPESTRRRHCVDIMLNEFEKGLREAGYGIPHCVIAKSLKIVCPAMYDADDISLYNSYGSERALSLCVLLFKDEDPKAIEWAIKSALIALPRVTREQQDMLLKALCPALAELEAEGKMTESIRSELAGVMEKHPDLLGLWMVK